MTSKDYNFVNGIIKCPKCGCEYNIDEIFVPGALTGRSHRVIKNEDGKILYIDYLSEDDKPDYTERYKCDNCDCDFTVEAKITFATKPVATAEDFQNESVSLLD